MSLYSPEPWTEFKAGFDSVTIIAADGTHVAAIFYALVKNQAGALANVSRIVATVNAFEGITDPAGFVERAKAAGVMQ